jgi:hypothetical protein
MAITGHRGFSNMISPLALRFFCRCVVARPKRRVTLRRYEDATAHLGTIPIEIVLVGRKTGLFEI